MLLLVLQIICFVFLFAICLTMFSFCAESYSCSILCEPQRKSGVLDPAERFARLKLKYLGDVVFYGESESGRAKIAATEKELRDFVDAHPEFRSKLPMYIAE